MVTVYLIEMVRSKLVWEESILPEMGRIKTLWLVLGLHYDFKDF